MAKKRSRRRGIPLNGLIRFAAFAVVLAGALAGILMALNQPPNRLFGYLSVYLDTMEPFRGAFTHFIYRTLIYSQPVAIIWFLAFIPPAALFAYGILFIKVCGLAFTAAALWLHGGEDGLRHVLMFCGPQLFIWLPVCVYVVCGSAGHAAGQARVNFIMRGTEPSEAKLRVKFRSTAKSEYASRLLLGLLASVITAFIEAWLIF